MIQANEISSLERPSPEEWLLVREYTHRVNNEFTSAISAISVAATRSASGEVKAALAAVIDRLENYVRADRALRMPEQATSIDAASYLRQLCLAISRSKLDFNNIKLVLVERPLVINSERCWRLGMIVSELIANAARHAFRERGGTITVELLSTMSFVECRITDDGTAATNIRPGHGFQIVRALTQGLNGKIRQHFGPEGSTSVLSFPYAAQQIERSYVVQSPPTMVMIEGEVAI
ncbi:MAG TPA: sensor histidine kinase [Candidatus Acidoferrum sp.]|nr:sensor histidine kinase [Candidatus Acidoferrum sp.]